MRPALLVAAAGWLAAACGKKPAGPASEGRALYDALNCRACHRLGGQGGRGGPDLTFVGFRYDKEWLERFLADPQAWRKGTLMPDPRLSAARRAALVDFLASLKGEAYAGEAAPWRAARFKADGVERGHVLFATAGCISCHGKGGTGGYPNTNVPGGLIPGLKGLTATYSREELKRLLRSGSRPVRADPAGPAPLVAMPAWGKVLTDAELDALADYLFTLGDSPGAPADF